MTRILLLAAFAVAMYAQPKTENAKLQTRAVNGTLDASFRTIVSSQVEPAWIGYQVTQVSGERSMCGTVSLEGAKEFVVLYRVAAGQVEKIRTYATDCTFDAGDLPLYWLTGVDGSQSALLLASFIPPADTNKKGLEWQLANSALSAIARHQDGAPALIDLARRPQVSAQMRQEAVRWLGRSKDPRATKFFEEILAAR
ncbi:MAG TPA: hypothetical protein VK752_10725 [Bryobacteraceae bacterium]|nr:hypothetical protein [Bryobacteraceae bacterium]